MDDLDDFEGEDWKGRIFGGKYDNRYGGPRPYGSKIHKGNNRSKKKTTLGIILSLVVIAVVFYLEIPIPYFEDKSVKIMQDTKNIIQESGIDKIKNSEIYNQTISTISNIEKPNVIRTQSGFNHTQIEYHIWDFTNQNRLDHGLSALTRIVEIDSIAQDHSKDMAIRGYFEHNSPEGHDPSDRSDFAGYSCKKDYGSYYTEGLSENIFLNHTFESYLYYVKDIPISYDWYSSEESLAYSIVDGWMNSPGHRENILDYNYDKIGVGVHIDEDEAVYSTQNFC